MANLKVAVVTENHPVDIFAFTTMLNKLPKISWYMQSIDLLAKDDANREKYDVFLFYHLSKKLPQDEKVRWFVEEYLGSTNQGIVLLHHAVCCYHGASYWEAMTGIPDRTFVYHWDQVLECKIQNPQHPITQGMKDFVLDDETYEMAEPSSQGTEVLVTVEHPLSMKTLAWTRQYHKSKVFNYVSGHDEQAYTNPHFLQILGNGVQWTGSHGVHD